MLIHLESWLMPDVRMLVTPMRKARIVRSVAACRPIGATVTLIVYHFATGVVEHMVGCFTIFRGLIFFFEFSSHFVVFVEHVKCPAFSPQTAQ